STRRHTIFSRDWSSYVCSSDLDAVSYIRSLAEEIKYGSGRDMKIALDLPEKLDLKIEKTTSLGLIINELMTNSIKHVQSSTHLRSEERRVGKEGMSGPAPNRYI